MIEIEKKFLLSSTQRQALLNNAHELSKTTFKDSYFDTDNYRLTINNLWFRKRGDTYELKAPLKSTSTAQSATNRFHEITDTHHIRQKLELTKKGDLESELARNGILRFMTCITNRKSYEKQGFRIDIDSATYLDSNFTYAIAEIELLLEDESGADDAERRIIAFAKSFNLTTDQLILGKVAAYLKAERPHHFQALVDAGVLT